jgi:hypothetical protein
VTEGKTEDISKLKRLDEMIGNVDVVDGVAVRNGGVAVSLAGKPIVTVAGWAIGFTKPGQKMLLSVNGRIVACEYGQSRADVALALRDNRFTNSGYTCRVSSGVFSAGENTMEPIMTTDEGSSYRAGKKVMVSVTH